MTALVNIGSALRRNKLALAGFGFLVGLTLATLCAPLVAPHDPARQDLQQRLQPPSRSYPLGTDEMGRCILSRMLFGGRVSLLLALSVTGITVTVGTLLGLLAGYLGRLADEIVMRVTDVFLAFPGLVLALVVAGLMGPGLSSVIVALSATGWTRYARLVRGCVLSVKQEGFVESTRALGGGRWYVMVGHVLPEVLPPVMVMATLGMGWVILGAASLNFLGFGVQPPTPEWGAMISSGRQFMRVAHQLVTFPGMAIMLTVLAFNFLGDGLRDALDPRRPGTGDRS